ncbi:melanocyte-stimulating hormone receptor-like [Ruditapes philippinarum]|uniref:melanocyte-stimulating hormone receptor-like n=1 Tax=Ruditapes philippinarum TaxID=129788 RepID=UPI00295AB5E3|nr:melanocyte-stimulating hormone receptor-like [Ruditapes philippinarum]
MCETNSFLDNVTLAMNENAMDVLNSSCGNLTQDDVTVGNSSRGNLTQDDVTVGNSSRAGGNWRSYGSYQKFSCGYCDTACIYSAIETLFIIGIVANMFVITRVIRDRNLHDPTFVAIAALAIADLLFLTLNLTTSFERVILSVTCSSPVIISSPYYILKSIFWFSANTHVALLAVLRYITLAYPLRANAYLTIKKVIISSIVVWIIGMIITGSLTALINAKIILAGRSQEFLLYLWLSVYFLPLVITCVLHILKICMVKGSISFTTTDATRKSIQRMSKIVVVVIVMAAVLPLPRLIHKCLKLAGRDVYPPSDFRTHFGEIADCLFLINNFINPFIYGFMSEKFRGSLKSMFSWLPGVNEDSIVTSDTPLSSRKMNYNLGEMPRKYSYADSLDSVNGV